jgi:hypothetical protein
MPLVLLLAGCSTHQSSVSPTPEQTRALDAALAQYESRCLNGPSSLPRERQVLLCQCVAHESRKVRIAELIAVGTATSAAGSQRERTEIVLENERIRQLVQRCANEVLAPIIR